MKLYLTGEGPTDCGKSVYNKKSGTYTWADGPVQVYIQKIAPGVEILSAETPKKEHRAKRNQRTMKGLTGHGLKAFFIAQEAQNQGCDITAMYVDADKETGSTQKTTAECQKRYSDVKSQVIEGLTRGGAANPLAIVPMKMIESWIMGDPSAFQRLFGWSSSSLPARPELLWGDKHNPDSDYPKNRLSKILSEYGVESTQDTFTEIARHTDIAALQQTCPISFGDFVHQLSSCLI